MAYQTVPIYVSQPNQDVSNSAIKNQMRELRDMYVKQSEDGLMIKKRFGYLQKADTGQNTKGDGLYWFEALQAFIVVCNAKVFVMRANYTLTDITGTDLLVEGALCRFSEKVYAGRTYLFICNGGNLIYTDDLGSTTQKVSGINFDVGNVTNLNNFMIINQIDSNLVYYNSGDPRTWSIVNNFQATGNADKVDTLKVVGSNLYIWGKRSVEVWAINLNGIIPLSKQRETGITEGVISPNSVVEIEKSQIFLDEHKKIKVLSGSKVSSLSNDYSSELENIVNAQDSEAFYMQIDGKRFYVINFNYANRSFLVDLDLNVISELSYFDEVQGTYNRFRGNCYAYASILDKHVMLDYENGLIYELSTDYATDNNSSIRAFIETGNIDHGTPSFKRSKNLSAIIERPVSQNAEYKIQIQHRDNGSRRYTSLKNISLKNTLADGDDVVRLIGQGGRYKRRQYKAIFPDPTSITISSITEEVEIESR